MALVKIPFDSDPDQEFQVDLDGRTYTLRAVWNGRASQWQMAIYDEDAVEQLFGPVPVLVGYPLFPKGVQGGDLPPGEFVAIDTRGAGTNPGAEDLGSNTVIFYEEASSVGTVV